jgi:Protein of unknown function (DUF1573)
MTLPRLVRLRTWLLGGALSLEFCDGIIDKLREDLGLSYLERTLMNLSSVRLLVFGLVLLLQGSAASSIACAQNEWARKMFKEFEHDFGTVVKGEEVEYRFQIENVYQEEMRIQSVTSSCGCTQVSVTKNVLKTWEKAEVVAKFMTKTYSGSRKARITVTFAQPFYGVVYLDIKGTIRTDTMIDPGVVNFGTLIDPTKSSRTINISRFGNPAWKITDVKSTYPHVVVSLKETARNSSYVTYQLTASLKKSTPTGFLQNELVLVARDRPGDATSEMNLPVPLIANISTPVHVSPGILPIVSANNGQLVTEKVVLMAEQPFRINDVTCADSSFRVRAANKSASLHVVQLEYMGNANTKPKNVELTFITDFPAQREVKLKAIISADNN